MKAQPSTGGSSSAGHPELSSGALLLHSKPTRGCSNRSLQAALPAFPQLLQKNEVSPSLHPEAPTSHVIMPSELPSEQEN